VRAGAMGCSTFLFPRAGRVYILRAMGAWRGWYHVNGNTYGTWLPGDPRGWREKRHRKHVPGDYKNPPPPGFGDDILRRSRRLLKYPPVRFDPDQRELAGTALVETLLARRIEVLALSMDAIHYHILGRFPDGQVRRHVGRAKLHAYHLLRERWQVGKVWQALCNVTPVSDRTHQVNVFRYIRSHADKGAWVWTFHEGVYRRPSAPP